MKSAVRCCIMNRSPADSPHLAPVRLARLHLAPVHLAPVHLAPVRRLAAAALLALAGLTAATPALAGRSCEAKPMRAERVMNGLTLAQRTAAVLDQQGASVALIARIGQDLSRYGLTYSHLGVAFKRDGAWRVAHKLNDCGTAEAGLFWQGLGEFFLDDPFRFEAGILIPTPEVQQALAPVFSARESVLRLHEPRYNLVSYPWSQRYQQSNQWVLETMAMALSPGVGNRTAAQAWLRERGYQPTVLALGTATRLGARLTAANVAFDDHPSEKRFAGQIETITVESVFAFAERAGLGRRIAPVTP